MKKAASIIAFLVGGGHIIAWANAWPNINVATHTSEIGLAFIVAGFALWPAGKEKA
jgi:hypothetical protein